MMRFKWPLVIFMIVVCWLSLSCQEQKIWPTEGWKKSSPAEQGMNEKYLSDLDEKITNGDYGYIDGFIIIRNGYLVYEKSYMHDYVKINHGLDDSKWQYNYYNPDWHPFYKGTQLHTLQSVTKSVTSAAIGMAIDRKELPGVNVKIVDIFKDEDIENLDERKKSMSLEDVLTMRAGIDWNESIPYTDPNNTCIQLEASDDWFKFVINRPMEAEPGTEFEYNSGASLLLSAVIKESTGMHIDKYVEKYLFKPLGISRYYWKITPTGLPDTEGGLYLEPYDLAKIGYLYLNDGIWDGRPILSEGWVKATVTPHIPDIAPDNENINIAYGYQWWLAPYDSQSKEYIYVCSGYGGQYLLVAAKYNLIAVINGWNIYGKPSISIRVFFDNVIKAIKNTDRN